MAHEKLRFPLVLNSQKKADSLGDFTYSPLYSDMAYGSHYAIYADFNGHISIKGKSGFLVDSIDFRLQNFAGHTAVGITKVVGYKEKNLDEAFRIKGFSTGRLIKFYLILQGLNCNFQTSLPHKGQDDTNEGPSLGLELFQGDVIEVGVFYESVNNDFSKIYESPEVRNKSCLFADPYYLYRDGEEIELKKDALKKAEIIQLMKEKGLDAAISQAKLGGWGNKTKEGTDDIIFEALGGARVCKMKLSDVYIL